jgi:hypothetical protein
LKLVGVPLKLPATTAVPLSATSREAVEASLVKAKVPVASPAEDGVNTMLTLVV